LFRIDRSLVNLAAVIPVQIEVKAPEAGAVGETPDAAAFAAELIKEQAYTEAQSRANEILCEAETKARAKTEEIMSEARNEAAALLINAREQAELDRRAAWQEGFTGGAEEGKHSYDEQLASKIHEDDEKLKHVIEEFYNERTNTYDRLEDDVVKLAIQIVRKVLDPAEDEFGEYFESIITGALRQISPEGKIMIRVSPAEYERFFTSGIAAFELDSGATVTASVLKDTTLGRGDCIIDTEAGVFNAGLESQLKYIEIAFSQIEH